MTIINQKTKEVTTINDKNSRDLEALLKTCPFEDCTYIVSTEDILLYGVTPEEYNVEEAIDHVYHIKLNEEKATKKPTVGDVMDMEKKYREVIMSDLVQSAVFCDGGDTTENYEVKRMDAMSAWRDLEAHLGDDKEGHRLFDEYMTKVNIAVSTLLCDVYRKALHDSLSIPETLELCQWFKKTETDTIFDGLPTL